MKFNKNKLVKLLNDLKSRPNVELSPSLEDEISDYWGVLRHDESQIDWLQFIITTYA